MDVKKGPYYEYSVVYTERTYNLMSPPFQDTMKDINIMLKKTYKAAATAVIPGSGTFAMEAVARQFGTGKKCFVVRVGYFSYRWSDIFKVCNIPSEEVVLKSQPAAGQAGEALPVFEPPAIEDVVAAIKVEKPAVVFAPHVETSNGIMLPRSYIRALAEAAHAVDALLVIDDIAGGNVWLDMQDLGIDVLITAPQKGWSGPACVGIVLLGERGLAAVKAGGSGGSFCLSLTQWLDVMDKYENKDGSGPGFRYYTTLPTDGLMAFCAAMKEGFDMGLDVMEERMLALGTRMRAELAVRGFKGTAAVGFEAPGVVVVYNSTEGIVGKLKEQGLQVAGGVPWMVDEAGAGVDSAKATFRVGLFGLDKLAHVDAVVARFTSALDNVLGAAL